MLIRLITNGVITRKSKENSMFIITNRKVDQDAKGFDCFGHVPNENGPNELRIVEVERKGRGWSVTVLDDEPTGTMKKEVGLIEPKDPNDPTVPYYASDYVARKLQRLVPQKKRHILFYVHGFNNDMKDVVQQAALLESIYKIVVIPFSWPAKGGGAISGTLNYRKDKSTARLSVGALDRTISKVHDFLARFNEDAISQITQKAEQREPDNPIKRDALISKLVDEHCPWRVSALFHSMGNYLFKHALQSDIFASRKPVFDNIILAAADTNSHDHATWVDRINCRGRVFVTINENDYALGASRMKMGEAQLARLGHYLRGLNATRATYIDVTHAEEVRKSHSYFLKSAEKNATLRRFFRNAFRGKSAEAINNFEMPYCIADNAYHLE